MCVCILRNILNHQTDARKQNCGYAIKFCGFMEIVTIILMNSFVLEYYTHWTTAFVKSQGVSGVFCHENISLFWYISIASYCTYLGSVIGRSLVRGRGWRSRGVHEECGEVGRVVVTADLFLIHHPHRQTLLRHLSVVYLLLHGPLNTHTHTHTTIY